MFSLANQASQTSIARRFSGYSSFLFPVVLFLLQPQAAASSQCEIPREAAQEDVSSPTQVVGNGTPASCTSEAFVAAVAQGGIITFSCGVDPVTITLTETAKVFNNTGPQIVIDGGNLVTLSGNNAHRILYMNTCDPNQIWTTPHCQDQDHPRLTVQNLTFADGNAEGETVYTGGGAIFVRGGRFKIHHCRFVRNRCASTGPDVGGAAVRVFDQHDDLPVYVVDSVFGGAEGDGNSCSNGGGLSSIGVSYTVINSLFSHNEATGYGGNPAQSGTPGGGSGGAIYNDGNTMTLSICGTAIHDNQVNAHGSGIFFVSNNHTGNIEIANSGLWHNTGGTWYPVFPDISCHSDTPIDNDGVFHSDEPIEKHTTIDVNGDEDIGLAEVLHALETVAGGGIPEVSDYGRKFADTDYNHELDVADVIGGLRLLTDRED